MTPAQDSRTGGTRARRAAKHEPVTVVTEPTPGRVHTERPAPVASPSRRRTLLDPDTLLALEEERTFLLASLDDLEREHDAGDVDDADYEGLRDDYTARAAATIRALDDHASYVRAHQPQRSWFKIISILVVVAVISGALARFVASSSDHRDPGGSSSGDIRSSSIDEIAKAKRFTAEAQQSLQAGDSGAAVSAYRNAIDAYRAALDIDPNNVEALTYKGWLLHNLALQAGAGSDTAVSVDAEAMELLDQALAIKPTYPDALVFRAVMAEGQGRPADALVDLDALPADSLPTFMTSLVDGVRQRAEAAVAAGGTATTG